MNYLQNELTYDLNGLMGVSEKEGSSLVLSGMSLNNAANRLEEIANDVRYQASVRKLYQTLTRKGCIDLKEALTLQNWASSEAHVAVVEREDTVVYAVSNNERAALQLVRDGVASIESNEEEFLLVVGPPPPEEHPMDLCLYELDVGITYWIAAPHFKKEDYDTLVKSMTALILENEGTPVTDDPVTQFAEVYADDAPSAKEVRRIFRPEGIRAPCRVDDGRNFITMWTGFCEMMRPGIVACSEW